MSAPKTNIEKQSRRHPALRLMGVCVAFAVVIGIAYAIYVAAMGNEPRDATKIDGRTGDVIEQK